MTAVVSGTTIERPKTIGGGGQSGNERIVIDRGKRVENERDTLDGTKPETIAPRRIRVTQNPEYARQEDAATGGINRTQQIVAGHVPQPPGRAGGQAQRLENSRNVDTDENAGVSAGAAGRVKLATQAEDDTAEVAARRSELGHPAGETSALEGGVVDRPGLRHYLPRDSGEAAQNPIRARAAGTTGMKNAGHELGQVRRTRPARPRTRPANHTAAEAEAEEESTLDADSATAVPEERLARGRGERSRRPAGPARWSREPGVGGLAGSAAVETLGTVGAERGEEAVPESPDESGALANSARTVLAYEAPQPTWAPRRTAWTPGHAR